MNTEIILLVASLLYGIPSLLLYVVIVVQLKRPKYSKRFSNPFFRLCFLIGIVDCVGYVVFYCAITLPTYSLFAAFYGSSLFTPSALTSGLYFSSYFFGYLQLFGNCFLTLNRFTSIVFPTHHALIWKYLFSVSVLATVIAALAPCWHLLTTSAFYAPLFGGSGASGFGMNYDKRKYPKSSNSFNLLVSSFVCCVLCLVLNAVACVFLVLHSMRTVVVTKSFKAERNLFFLALVLFGLQCLLGLHQVLIHVAILTGNNALLTVLYTMLPWLYDLKWLSPPWVLVVISTSVREAVMRALPKRCLLWQKKSLSGGTTVTVTSMKPLKNS